MTGIVVGIDASRNRSGGAKAHLVGILGQGDPARYGIGPVHVWSYKGLLDALPDASWLIKHNPPPLEGSLLRQAAWQYFWMPTQARRHSCEILLSTDAGTIGAFRPSVVMSRDMLSYEPGEMLRYGYSKARLRLWLLRHIQARSMKRAQGVVFLTRYAADTIQSLTGKFPRIRVIPHGVGEAFRQPGSHRTWPQAAGEEIRCLYVSNAAMYKHQWVVVRAIGELRKRGYNLSLCLVGGGSGKAQQILDEEIARSDADGCFVRKRGFVSHERLPEELTRADVFIFASSCENMPHTLVEGMAGGLPIACSDRGPMPEILQDGGVYFDPEDSASIAAAVERIISDRELRATIAVRARELSEQYSWTRCARETWTFIRETARG
jgi:glycosyltransferase involved in cell wall biosynthesis